MSTEMQWLWTLVVDGQSIGVFDTSTGTDAVSASAKHRPGGMGPEKTYVALPQLGTATFSRVYERERDHELVRSLSQKAGRVTASATMQPLDEAGHAWGKPIVYSGRFLGVKPGNTDSTSNNPRMLELDIDVEVIA